MDFQHILTSPSSNTHFITSMTQKLKARVQWGQEAHPKSGTHDGDLFLQSFSPGHKELLRRRLLDLFTNEVVLPSTQKSREL